MARPIEELPFNKYEVSVLQSLIATKGIAFPKNPYLLQRVVRALLHRIEILSPGKAEEARLLLKVMVAHEHRLKRVMNLRDAQNDLLIGTFLLHNPPIKRQLKGLAIGTVPKDHWIAGIKEQRRLLVQYLEDDPLPKATRNSPEWVRRGHQWFDQHHNELFPWLTAFPCLHPYPSAEGFRIESRLTPRNFILAILAHLHNTTTNQIAKLLKPSSRI